MLVCSLSDNWSFESKLTFLSIAISNFVPLKLVMLVFFVKVAEDLPDQIRLLGLAAGGNSELLLDQTRKHKPAVISINDPDNAGGSVQIRIQTSGGTAALSTVAGLSLVSVGATGSAEPAFDETRSRDLQIGQASKSAG